MIDGLIAGRLIGDPERRQGKGNSTYVVAKVRAQSGENEHMMVNLIAYAALQTEKSTQVNADVRCAWRHLKICPTAKLLCLRSTACALPTRSARCSAGWPLCSRRVRLSPCWTTRLPRWTNNRFPL